VSRLSRTDKDWCQLLELCQLFDTLVGDADNIYDVSALDDQLVLGIKGTLSVVELRILKMRMQEGRENKARRGELHRLLAPGYVLDGSKRPVKDPNLRVQESIELLFSKFRETWSIRQTYRWFIANDIEVPTNKARAGKWELIFQKPTHGFIANALHNPFYAGAYFFGRRATETKWVNGAIKKTTGRVRTPEETRVFIREHHEGYIGWESFEENQRMIKNNKTHDGIDTAIGAAREGKGLLGGVLRCGRCGRKMHVRYAGKSGTYARYLCSGDFGTGGAYCLGFGGNSTDKFFGEEIVRVVSPLGIQASIEAIKSINAENETKRQAIERQMQQLQYETTRAFEQYNEVDPRNRLVAAELEKRWNAKLQELEQARTGLTGLEKTFEAPTEADINLIKALGQQFGDVWRSDNCPMVLKKKILRTLVKEVIAQEEPAGILRFVIHWQGGSHTMIEMKKPSPAEIHKTADDDIEVIKKMSVRYGDDEIARVLNKLGRKTGKGHPWSESSVTTISRKHKIDGVRKRETYSDPNILSLKQAEVYARTSDTTLKRLVQAGILPLKQVVPFAPWEIRRSDLDSEPVRAILEHLKKTGRLLLKGNPPDLQLELCQ
jgi:hypothetical protein